MTLKRTDKKTGAEVERQFYLKDNPWRLGPTNDVQMVSRYCVVCNYDRYKNDSWGTPNAYPEGSKTYECSTCGHVEFSGDGLAAYVANEFLFINEHPKPGAGLAEYVDQLRNNDRFYAKL